MKIDTSKTYSGDEVQRLLDQVSPVGKFQAIVTRADGSVETHEVRNIVLSQGLNRLANRAVQATGTTPFFVIGVGTSTAAHSLGSDQPNWGEVSRKTSIVTGANAQSREWIFLSATWGGAADSVTSVALDTVFTSDFVNSHATNGDYLNAANGLGVTLANSDFLLLTARIRVGSHDLSHTT